MEWEETSSQTRGPVTDDRVFRQGRKKGRASVRTCIHLSRWASLAYQSACLSYYRYPSTWCTPRARVHIDAIFQNHCHCQPRSFHSLAVSFPCRQGLIPFSLSISQPSPPAVSLRVRRPRRRHTFVISHLYLSPLYPISPNALKAARPLIPPY